MALAHNVLPARHPTKKERLALRVLLGLQALEVSVIGARTAPSLMKADTLAFCVQQAQQVPAVCVALTAWLGLNQTTFEPLVRPVQKVGSVTRAMSVLSVTMKECTRPTG